MSQSCPKSTCQGRHLDVRLGRHLVIFSMGGEKEELFFKKVKEKSKKISHVTEFDTRCLKKMLEPSDVDKQKQEAIKHFSKQKHWQRRKKHLFPTTNQPISLSYLIFSLFVFPYFFYISFLLLLFALFAYLYSTCFWPSEVQFQRQIVSFTFFFTIVHKLTREEISAAKSQRIFYIATDCV